MTDLNELRSRVSSLVSDPVEALRMEIEIARVEALQAQAVEINKHAVTNLRVAEAIEALASVINMKRLN